MRGFRHFIHKQKSGQALIEFVIVLPVFLLLFFFCMDTSWYFVQKYSLNHLAETMVEQIPKPLLTDWEHKYGWITSGIPPWLTPSEATLWSWDDYQGWVSFDFPNYHGTGGPYSGYTAELYENNVKSASSATLISWDQVSYQLKGGWYIKPMVLNIPTDNPGNYVRTTERTENFYIDVNLSITYRYKPLTFVGDMMFCRDGSDTCEIVKSIRKNQYQGLFRLSGS